jgi:hypothetical protein
VKLPCQRSESYAEESGNAQQPPGSQALVLLDMAGMESESSDPEQLTHGQTSSPFVATASFGA